VHNSGINKTENAQVEHFLSNMAQKTSETSNIGLQSSTLNHPTIIQAIFQKVPHFRGIGLKILGSRL
jgi:hypothetical protein